MKNLLTILLTSLVAYTAQAQETKVPTNASTQVQEARMWSLPKGMAASGNDDELTRTEKAYLGIASVLALGLIGYRLVQRKSAHSKDAEDWWSKNESQSEKSTDR